MESINKAPRTKIPKYNVYSKSPNSKEDAIETMRDLFKKTPLSPVNINFCTQFQGDACSDGKGNNPGHAVTVTGVRTICCNDICHDEWHIKNSWGEDAKKNGVEGWVIASPLAESMSRSGRKMAYIRACDTGTSPLCSKSVQGF